MYAQLAQITATRCGVCNISLTDAESVEHGIGPTCSSRYYNPKHVPDKQQVKIAIGLLAASGLPDHIIDGFLNLVDGTEHNNARKASNLLVYWVSAHYNDRGEVFKCSAIIRALGYVMLADKLEADRTKLTLQILDTHIEASLPEHYNMERDLRLIPGVKRKVSCLGDSVKHGRKQVWDIPLDQEEHLNIVLGVYFGGHLAGGSKGIYKIAYKRVSDLTTFRNPLKPSVFVTDVSCPVQLKVLYNGHLLVTSPYNEQFKTDLKLQIPFKFRRWVADQRAWEVMTPYHDRVKALLSLHYGVTL